MLLPLATRLEGVRGLADAKRQLNVRVDPGVVDRLAVVAEVDRMSLAEAVEQAISEYVEARRVDPEFQRRRDQQVELLQNL